MPEAQRFNYNSFLKETLNSQTERDNDNFMPEHELNVTLTASLIVQGIY